MANPKIRFKKEDGSEFEDWKECKCGDVLNERNVQHPQNDDFPLVSFTVEDGVTPKTERYEREQLVKGDKKSKKYKETRLDDIVYNPANLKFGAIARNKYGNAVFSPIYVTYEVNKSLALPPFIEAIVTQDSFIQNALQYQQGTVYERMSVKPEDFALLDIKLPSIEEQTRINSLLSEIDMLISSTKEELEKTKELKKAMLQKCFPKEGQKIPEIRFKGTYDEEGNWIEFTDAWEQRKFSDFTWNAGKKNSQNLDLEPYAVTNDRGFIRQNEAHDEFGYMKDVDRKAYNIVMPNSFAYNPARINVGSIGYYEGAENVIVSSLYEVFQTADYVDDRFLWHWFKSTEFPKWIERLQEGSVRLYFYYDKLCECRMLMPSVDEQKRIAAYLDSLDNLITLHQRELEAYKKFKKAMMQKMFC